MLQPDGEAESQLRLQSVVAAAEGWRAKSNGILAAGLVGFIIVGLVLGTTIDDAEGETRTRWPTSVTVYNAASGEIEVIYGAASDEWLSFPPVS